MPIFLLYANFLLLSSVFELVRMLALGHLKREQRSLSRDFFAYCLLRQHYNFPFVDRDEISNLATYSTLVIVYCV